MERSFDLAGNPLGGEHQVSTSGADGAYSFTQRPNGTIFIAYENNGDIFGRTLDANWNRADRGGPAQYHGGRQPDRRAGLVDAVQRQHPGGVPIRRQRAMAAAAAAT